MATTCLSVKIHWMNWKTLPNLLKIKTVWHTLFLCFSNQNENSHQQVSNLKTNMYETYKKHVYPLHRPRKERTISLFQHRNQSAKTLLLELWMQPWFYQTTIISIWRRLKSMDMTLSAKPSGTFRFKCQSKEHLLKLLVASTCSWPYGLNREEPLLDHCILTTGTKLHIVDLRYQIVPPPLRGRVCTQVCYPGSCTISCATEKKLSCIEHAAHVKCDATIV